MSEVCVLMTASSVDEGRALARALVGERLAACVNIVPSIESHYWWEGKVEQADEVLLIAKSRRDLIHDLVARVKVLHSYSVAEVIAMDVVDGNPDYLRWLRAETRPV